MQHAKESFLSRSGRDPHEPGCRRALFVGRRERTLPVDPDAAPLLPQDRSFRQQLRALPPANLLQQAPDDAGGDGALDPTDATILERGDEAVEEAMAEPATVGGRETRFVGCQEEAAQESDGVARAWSQGCLVEVVDVEVVEPI